MILTVEQARASITTNLSDDALRLLLDAAEAAIDDTAGRLLGNEDQPVTEHHHPSGRMLMLGRRAGSVVSVTEGTTLLDGTSYYLRTSGTVIDRLNTGAAPALAWRGDVTVVYLPYSTFAERARVQIDLVKLDLAFSPGISSQSIGPWSESYASGKSYPEQRADILGSLSTPFVGIL